MTASLIWQLITEYKLSYKTIVIEVPAIAERIGGTIANLKEGEKFTILDLLYAMMLPSGNDAATTLAIYFGSAIRTRKMKKITKKKIVPMTEEYYIKVFVKRMNQLAQKMFLKNTIFFTPHGMCTTSNKSTSDDISKLSFHLMQIPIMQEIVKTATYTCKYVNKEKKTKEITWQNTNILLSEVGYYGIKTGTTTDAGYCLSTYWAKENKKIIIVLLGATSPENRFLETKKLVEWAHAYLNEIEVCFGKENLEGLKPQLLICLLRSALNSPRKPY